MLTTPHPMNASVLTVVQAKFQEVPVRGSNASNLDPSRFGDLGLPSVGRGPLEARCLPMYFGEAGVATIGHRIGFTSYGRTRGNTGAQSSLRSGRPSPWFTVATDTTVARA